MCPRSGRLGPLPGAAHACISRGNAIMSCAGGSHPGMQWHTRTIVIVPGLSTTTWVPNPRHFRQRLSVANALPLSTSKSDPLRRSCINIGTAQRRLAWPLRKNDTHKARSVSQCLASCQLVAMVRPRPQDSNRYASCSANSRSESPATETHT